MFCRYVERKLVDVWVDHQFTKDLNLDSSFSPSYCLRQRMLHFCRDYIYYSSVEVLEPQSHRFLASLEQAETVDVVLRSHEQFLDTCLRELLLTERESLYRHLSQVLSTCLRFATNLHSTWQKFASSQAPEARAMQVTAGQEQRRELLRQRQMTYETLLQQKAYSMMISKFKAM